MIESRKDLILRILDDIALLAARIGGLKALGLSEEIYREIDRLEQAAGQLDAQDRGPVDLALFEIRRQAGA